MPVFLAEVAINVLLAAGANAGVALTIGAFVADYALLIGGLALSANQAKSQKRRARQQFNASQVDRLVSVSTTTAPRELVMGRVRKGGSVFFRGSTGANKTTFVMAIALAAHEVDGLEAVYLNDELVSLDGAGNVTSAPYSIAQSGSATEYGTGVAQVLTYTPIAGTVRCFTGSTGGPEGDINDVGSTSGGGNIITTVAGATIQYQYSVSIPKANVRLVAGIAGQSADARMVTLFPSLWTAAHRAQGVAYLVCECTYDETAFPSGLPNFTAVIRGAKIYDPRYNLCTWSEAFDHASWTAITTKVVSANTNVAPDGTTTADTVTDNNAAAYLGIQKSRSIANDSASHCFSLYVLKTTGGTSSTLGVNFSLSGGTSVFQNVRLNTDTGQAYTTGNPVTVIDAGSYWRISAYMLNNSTGNTSAIASIYPATSGYNGGLSDVVTGQGSAVIWGAQWNPGTVALPYARTGEAAVTPVTAFSENPALMMRHVYQHAHFGKASITPAEDGRFCAAADACDRAQTYTVGGVPSATTLFRAAVVIPFGSDASAALDDLAQSMAGSWAFAGGELYLKPGVYWPSSLSFTDADLAVLSRPMGGSDEERPIAISVHRERAQKYNVVNATIWDKAQGYKQATLTPVRSAAYVAADGGGELAQAVSMPAVFDAGQAQHIAGVMMRDARDPLTVSMPFKMRAYPVELFDTVQITLIRYGWMDKQFQVVGKTLSSDGVVWLSLKEISAAIYTVDAAFLAQGYANNTALPSPWFVPTIGTLTITSGTSELVKQADGTITSRMRVTWPALQDASVLESGSVEVQYRSVLSAGAWTSVTVSGNENQVVIDAVQDLLYYSVRARARNKTAVGVWSAQETHRVIGKTAAPPPFDVFTVLVQPDGTRQFNFSYTTLSGQPADWLGGEIRYVSGAVGSPDWSTMSLLQDLTAYYTHSPVELNAPLAGTYTFACKSIDTTGNESSYKLVTITLPERRSGNLFAEYFEHTEGWLGVKTGCHVQAGFLEANDTTTWGTLPATWDAYTRWNRTPTSPITYETPMRDFGTIIAGQVNSTLDADGSIVQELATSTNGTTWSGWSAASAPFSTRYLKLRVTVTATGPLPVPLIRSWSYQINAPVRSEYLNDIVLSTLTGSYRIGVGDIRIPLAGSYYFLKKTDVTIQDSSAGTWTATRIDQSLSPAPRWQFRLNGTLADPALVDFYIEGF